MDIEDIVCVVVTSVNTSYIGSTWLLFYGLPEEIYKIILFIIIIPGIQDIYFSRNKKRILKEFIEVNERYKLLNKWLVIVYYIGSPLIFIFAVIYGK